MFAANGRRGFRVVSISGHYCKCKKVTAALVFSDVKKATDALVFLEVKRPPLQSSFLDVTKVADALVFLDVTGYVRSKGSFRFMVVSIPGRQKM